MYKISQKNIYGQKKKHYHDIGIKCHDNALIECYPTFISWQFLNFSINQREHELADFALL